MTKSSVSDPNPVESVQNCPSGPGSRAVKNPDPDPGASATHKKYLKLLENYLLKISGSGAQSNIMIGKFMFLRGKKIIGNQLLHFLLTGEGSDTNLVVGG